MPVITETSTIHTKVIGVTDENRQGLLIKMMKRPEFVIAITIENMEVFVLMEIDNRPVKFSLGIVKDKYLPFIQDKVLKVKKWRITGGHVMPEYNNRLQPLGLNITLNY